MTPPLDEAALYDAFDSAPDAIVSFLLREVQAANLSAPLRVLDIGCGPGRMLPAFAALGWTVHGVEPDAGYRAFASNRCAGIPGTTVSDRAFETLDFESEFDVALSVNSVLNYVLSPTGRAAALRRTYRAIRPGGLLLLDLANVPWMLEHYVQPKLHTAQHRGETLTLMDRHETDHVAKVFTTHRRITVGEGPLRTESVTSHRYAIIEREELLAGVHDAGFHGARTFRGWSSPSSDRSEGARIIVAAQRPGA